MIFSVTKRHESIKLRNCPIPLTRYFESVWGCHFRPTAFISLKRRTTERPMIWIPISVQRVIYRASSRAPDLPHFTTTKKHMILFDISRPSDRVWHEDLLKLVAFGFFSAHIPLTSSFLTRRVNSVRVFGVLSQPFSVNAGIFQSSEFSYTFYYSLLVFWPRPLAHSMFLPMMLRFIVLVIQIHSSIVTVVLPVCL